MRTVLLSGGVLVLLILSSLGGRDLPSLEGAAAAPTTINFDDRSVGTRIVDQYPGVQFPDGAFIRSAVQIKYATQSPPNFLEKDCTGTEFDTMPLRIQFTSGQGWVGVYVGNRENFEQTVIMRAYDAMTGGRLVGTAEARLGPRAGVTTLLQLCRAVDRDIRRVEIALGDAGCEVIDDLSFDPDPLRTLGGPTTVNFDDRPEFTWISTQYAGLDFPDRPAIWRATSLETTTSSPPNLLVQRYDGADEFDRRPLRVNFTRLQGWVRVRVGSPGSGPGHRYTMRAFPTGSRTPVAIASADIPARAPITTPLEICRVLERDISRVEIHSSDVFEHIDDFQFAGARVPPPPSDTQPPRVFIDSPRTGDFFFRRDVGIPVRVRITENRGLELVRMIHEQLDGTERTERVLTDLVRGSAPNFTVEFIDVYLFPGRNRIRIEATDTAGNRATNPEREIIVTLAPPMEVIIDRPRPDQVFSGSPITVMGRVRKAFGTLTRDRVQVQREVFGGERGPFVSVDAVSGSAPEFYFITVVRLRSERVRTGQRISIKAISEDGAIATASVDVVYELPDIYLFHQVTQGTTQRGDFGRGLVADRRTVVRIHVSLFAPGGSVPRVILERGRIILSAARGGRELGELRSTDPYIVELGSGRLIDFLLPMEWTRPGDVELTARLISPEGYECGGLCLENNTYRWSVRFSPPKTLRIIPVKVRLRDVEPISDDQIAPLFEAIRRTYPVSQLEILPPVTLNSSTSRADFDRDVEGARKRVLREITNSFTCYRAIEDVGSFFDAVWAWITDCGWDTYWAGILPPSLGCPGGLAWPNSPASISEATAWAVAHEVAHCLGRSHAGNAHGEGGGGGFDPRFPYDHGTIGHPGFDTTAMMEIPAAAPYPPGWRPTIPVPCREAATPEHTHDFMSYGRGPYWISPYTWTGLFDHPFRGGLRGAFSRASASAATVQSDSGVYLYVSGDFTEDGNVNLRPFYTGRLPAGASVIAGEGRYSVVFERADGRVLFTGRFDPVAIHDAGALAFSTIVPFPAGTARIVIKEGERVLATRIVSAHAPQVTLLSPREGDVWGAEERQTIMWMGGDADGDAVYYVVRYTPDGGRTWIALNDWTTETQIEADASGLAGSSQALIEIVATDGVNTTRVLSAPFRVSAKGPYVLIYDPRNDSIVRPNQPIRLEGTANDREDGELPESALQWSSDRDGLLGHGRRVEVARLSPGVHRITLTATDSDRQTGQASIIVRVAQQQTLRAMPGLSGSVDNARRVDDKSGITVGNGPKVGQPPREQIIRGFLSFDLAALPSNVEIIQARLTLTQKDISGDPYFKGLGGVIVDLVDYGSSLDADDFGAPVLVENVGTLSDNGLLGPKELDVTEAIRWARAKGLSRVQFRLRFSQETDDDGSTDTVIFDPASSTQLLELHVVVGRIEPTSHR